MHVEQVRIRKEIKDARESGNAKTVADLSKANDTVTKGILKMYGDLGLMERKGGDSGPFQKVAELRSRAPEFLRKHGMERAYGCQNCGTVHMVYVLGKSNLHVDWDAVREQLKREGKHSDEIIDAWISTAKNLRLDSIEYGKTMWVDHPLAHPFLRDDEFPVWSPEVRDLMKQSCSCGKPKLTMDEGAYILRISPAGLDQLLQQDNVRNGLPAVEGVEVEVEKVFAREGSDEESAEGETVENRTKS
jgi:hypothetical protein